MNSSSDYLRVPDGLRDLLKGLTTQILLEKPLNLYEFSAVYIESVRERNSTEISRHEKTKKLRNEKLLPSPIAIALVLQSIPEGLTNLIKDFTKAALRNQPENIYEFGIQYFRSQRRNEKQKGNERNGSILHDTIENYFRSGKSIGNYSYFPCSCGRSRTFEHAERLSKWKTEKTSTEIKDFAMKREAMDKPCSVKSEGMTREVASIIIQRKLRRLFAKKLSEYKRIGSKSNKSVEVVETPASIESVTETDDYGKRKEAEMIASRYQATEDVKQTNENDKPETAKLNANSEDEPSSVSVQKQTVKYINTNIISIDEQTETEREQLEKKAEELNAKKESKLFIDTQRTRNHLKAGTKFAIEEKSLAARESRGTLAEFIQENEEKGLKKDEVIQDLDMESIKPVESSEISMSNQSKEICVPEEQQEPRTEHQGNKSLIEKKANCTKGTIFQQATAEEAEGSKVYLHSHNLTDKLISQDCRKASDAKDSEVDISPLRTNEEHCDNSSIDVIQEVNQAERIEIDKELIRMEDIQASVAIPTETEKEIIRNSAERPLDLLEKNIINSTELTKEREENSSNNCIMQSDTISEFDGGNKRFGKANQNAFNNLLTQNDNYKEDQKNCHENNDVNPFGNNIVSGHDRRLEGGPVKFSLSLKVDETHLESSLKTGTSIEVQKADAHETKNDVKGKQTFDKEDDNQRTNLEKPLQETDDSKESLIDDVYKRESSNEMEKTEENTVNIVKSHHHQDEDETREETFDNDHNRKDYEESSPNSKSVACTQSHKSMNTDESQSSSVASQIKESLQSDVVKYARIDNKNGNEDQPGSSDQQEKARIISAGECLTDERKDQKKIFDEESKLIKVTSNNINNDATSGEYHTLENCEEQPEEDEHASTIQSAETKASNTCVGNEKERNEKENINHEGTLNETRGKAVIGLMEKHSLQKVTSTTKDKLQCGNENAKSAKEEPKNGGNNIADTCNRSRNQLNEEFMENVSVKTNFDGQPEIESAASYSNGVETPAKSKFVQTNSERSALQKSTAESITSPSENTHYLAECKAVESSLENDIAQEDNPHLNINIAKINPNSDLIEPTTVVNCLNTFMERGEESSEQILSQNNDNVASPTIEQNMDNSSYDRMRLKSGSDSSEGASSWTSSKETDDSSFSDNFVKEDEDITTYRTRTLRFINNSEPNQGGIYEIDPNSENSLVTNLNLAVSSKDSLVEGKEIITGSFDNRNSYILQNPSDSIENNLDENFSKELLDQKIDNVTLRNTDDHLDNISVVNEANKDPQCSAKDGNDLPDDVVHERSLPNETQDSTNETLNDFTTGTTEIKQVVEVDREVEVKDCQKDPELTHLEAKFPESFNTALRSDETSSNAESIDTERKGPASPKLGAVVGQFNGPSKPLEIGSESVRISEERIDGNVSNMEQPSLEASSVTSTTSKVSTSRANTVNSSLDGHVSKNRLANLSFKEPGESTTERKNQSAVSTEISSGENYGESGVNQCSAGQHIDTRDNAAAKTAEEVTEHFADSQSNINQNYAELQELQEKRDETPGSSNMNLAHEISDSNEQNGVGQNHVRADDDSATTPGLGLPFGIDVETSIPYRKLKETEDFHDKERRETFLSLSDVVQSSAKEEDSLEEKTAKLQMTEEIIKKMKQRCASETRIGSVDERSSQEPRFDELILVSMKELDQNPKLQIDDDSIAAFKTFKSFAQSDVIDEHDANTDFKSSAPKDKESKELLRAVDELLEFIDPPKIQRAESRSMEENNTGINELRRTQSLHELAKSGNYHGEVTLKLNTILAAVKIQAAARGFLTRMRFRKSILNSKVTKNESKNLNVSKDKRTTSAAIKDYDEKEIVSYPSSDSPESIERTRAARRHTLQRGDAVHTYSTPEANSTSKDSETTASSFVKTVNLDEQVLPSFRDAESTSSAVRVRKKINNKLRWFALRQNSMPVQIDSEVFRVIPKHMRKRIKSADSHTQNLFVPSNVKSEKQQVIPK